MPVEVAAHRSLVVLPWIVGAVGSVGAAGAVVYGAGRADWILWTMAGFATGHSLSGSI